MDFVNEKGTGVLNCICASGRGLDLLSTWMVLGLILGSMCMRDIVGRDPALGFGQSLKRF